MKDQNRKNLRKLMQRHIKEIKLSQKRKRRFDKQVAKNLQKIGLNDLVLEALALLEDENLEWSGDFNAVRRPLAELIQLAASYPTLSDKVNEVAEMLLLEEC